MSDIDILIIEDSTSVVKFLTSSLKKLGYKKVHVCPNGMTGIKKFAELYDSDRLPLVFLDYYLPDIDAVSLFDQILEIQSETKIIIETVAGKEEKGVKYLTQHGAYHYLQKPLSFRNLKEVMNIYEKERVHFMKKSITDNELVRVRYKFKNERDSITVSVTEQQYVNLLELSIIEKCEIIGPTVKPINKKEKKEFNKMIRISCKSYSSHTKYLL